MSLLLDIDRGIIEIDIPNSEATVVAQHEGIKDRSVGAYYMNEIYENVKEFLNNFEGEFYVDLLRTYENMKKLYNYVEESNKISNFKSALAEQYTLMNDLEKIISKETIFKIPNPSVNENKKYIKFSRDNKYFSLFQDLLLGDITRIIIRKLSNNCFIIYGDYIPEYKSKIDYKI